MAREKRPAYRSPGVYPSAFMVIDPSVNPEDIRDAIPERTAITTDWMGQQTQAAKLRAESRHSGKGRGRALSKSTKDDTDLASQDQEVAIQDDDKYSFSGINAASMVMLMSSVPTPITGGSDKENNAPVSEEKGGEQEIPSKTELQAETEDNTSSDDPGSPLTPDKDTNIDEPKTMGELVASLGVRQTRHASYRKSS